MQGFFDSWGNRLAIAMLGLAAALFALWQFTTEGPYERAAMGLMLVTSTLVAASAVSQLRKHF